MPGFDQLHDIPDERRAALLRKLRALQAGAGMPGGDASGPPGSAADGGPGRPGQVADTATSLGARRANGPRRRRRGLAMVLGAATIAGAVIALLASTTGHDVRPSAAPRVSVSPVHEQGQETAPAQPGTPPAQPGTPPARKATPRPVASAIPASSPASSLVPASSAVPAAPPGRSPAPATAARQTEAAGTGCPGGLGPGFPALVTLPASALPVPDVVPAAVSGDASAIAAAIARAACS